METENKPDTLLRKTRRRTTKVVLWMVASVFLILVLAAATSYFWIDAAVKTTVQTAGSAAMGTEVTLDNVSLRLLRGEIDLQEMRIQNPPNNGYEKPFFFDLKDAAFKVERGTLLSNEIHVPVVEMTGLTMYLEPGDDGEYNHEVILANIEKFLESEQKETPQEDAEEIKVRVGKLVMRDVKVYYKTKLFIQTPLHVNEIVMDELDSTGEGVNVGQVLSIVIVGALRGVATELPSAVGKGVWDGTKAIGGMAKDLGVGIKDGVFGLFGGKKDSNEPDEKK